MRALLVVAVVGSVAMVLGGGILGPVSGLALIVLAGGIVLAGILA